MFEFKSSLGKTKFDLIVIIQSYPNLITAINYILSRADKRTLILVNGDRKIYKFLTKAIKNPRVTIKLYGNNIFLRSSFFSWALCWYVLYLQFRIPKFFCDEELITFGNWCDIGALFHNKVNNLKLTNLIAVEEERYTIKSDRRRGFPLFIRMINFCTNNLVERKHYFYEEDGEIKQIEKDNFGLDPSQIVGKSIKAPRERSYHLIDFDFKDSTQPFILYVEKNLLKSKSTSLYLFVKLNLSLYRFSKSNGLTIRIKFKPRDSFFIRRFFYRLLGFTILPTYAPAQIFAKHKNCACVIGFSSSAMAENYGKRVYCFGSIKESFNHSVDKHINSLKQRSVGSDVVFLKKLMDLENLRVHHRLDS
tara:strand:+ start:369 stop:1457 length:1089 start_codon:yes stop_codon:yes gene_type:complete